MSHLITIHENNVAVLYKKYAPVGVCAGNSREIDKFISQSMGEHGSLKVYGEHRLILLRKQEEEQANVA